MGHIYQYDASEHYNCLKFTFYMFDTNYMFVSFDAVSKMFKSKKTMQEHKRKQSQMSRPTSAFQATARPSFPTHMQTAGQAIDNTNPPSSAFQAMT